jgi:hypothetical protein
LRQWNQVVTLGPTNNPIPFDFSAEANLVLVNLRIDGPHYPSYFGKGPCLDVDLANILIKGLKRHMSGQTAIMAVYCEEVDIGTIGNMLTSAPNPLFLHLRSYCGFFDENEDSRRGEYFNVGTIYICIEFCAILLLLVNDNLS